MYDILGIGNAVTDILVEVDHTFITEHKLERGTMKLVNEDFINTLLHEVEAEKVAAGGSVANTLSTISSNLFTSTYFIFTPHLLPLFLWSPNNALHTHPYNHNIPLRYIL